MNNKQLIVHKENIFTKIINFFKKNFLKKKEDESAKPVIQNIEETKNNELSGYEKEKGEFWKIYADSKNGKVDLLSLSPETLKKMCIILEEEIKIKEKNNEIMKAKLKAY